MSLTTCSRSFILTLAVLLAWLTTPSLSAQAPEIIWASHPVNRAVDGGNAPITSAYPGASISDAAGNIYVAGSFNGVTSLGGDSVTNSTPGFTAEDVLLIKYAPGGKVLWMRQAGGNYRDVGRSLALDGAGGVYLSGTTASDTAAFGTNIVSAGAETALFLARYDADGNCQWVRRAGSWQQTWSAPVNRSSVIDSGLAVDSAGNPVVGGRFDGNPMFGGARVFSPFSQLIYTNGIVLTNRMQSAGKTTEDIFLAKFSPTGNILWATNHGGTNSEYASSIALDSSDNIYACGGFAKNTVLGGAFYTNSMFLAKFDPNGAPVWSSNLSEPTNHNQGRAWSVMVDSANRATVAFQTATSPFRLGTSSFTNELTSPNFSGTTASGLAQFDANGTLLWMKRTPFNVNGNSSSFGLTLTGDQANNIYLRAAANLMDSRFALGQPGLSVLKMQETGVPIWTNVVRSAPFQMTLGDGQASDQRGLPGISVAPSGRIAVIANIFGDRSTLGFIGWTNLMAFDNGTGNNLLTFAIESNYVGVLPQFLVQPTNMVFQPPQGLTNYALARGWPVADYRWHMITNGDGLRVGTNQTLRLPLTTLTNVTSYYVVASNLIGQSTSIFVFAQPLLAILPSKRLTNFILLGGSGTLSANATGTTAINYQWRINGTNLGGATGATLVLNNASIGASGLYTVVACNGWGCVTSTPPVLVKVVPPGSVDQTFVTSLMAELAFARLPDGRLLGAGGGIYPMLFQTLANGDFDPGFFLRPAALGGTYAWWRTGFFDQQGPREFLVEPDGRIVVAGNFQVFRTNATLGGWSSVGRMVRLTPDGFLDTSLNIGSGPSYPGLFAEATISALARQPDGKLIAAGAFRAFNNIGRTNIVRLNANGSIDDTFAGPTFASDTDFNKVGGISALALQPDGKILVGGSWQRVHGQDRTALIRLNANGTLDETFAVLRGKQDALPWPSSTSVSSIALLPSGKILITGSGLVPGKTGYENNAIFRINSDGTVDTTFAAKASVAQTSSTVVVAQPDGKILLGGSPTVTRFLPTGEIDPDWVFDPLLSTPLFSNAPSYTSRIVIEPGGFSALMAGNYGIRRILLDLNTGAVTPPNFPTGSAMSLPDGMFGFTTCGQPGQSMVIESSVDLVNWAAISTNSSLSGCVEFIDPRASLTTNGFYRVILLQ